MQPVRRFRILDAMVLTAAVACGLVYCGASPYTDKSFPGARTLTQQTVLDAVALGSFLTWAIALLVALDSISARLAPRGPGKVCVLLIAILSTIDGLANWRSYFHHPFFDTTVSAFMYQVFVQFPIRGASGLTTLVVWITLQLVGIKDSSNDWLEWSGNLLGTFWIMLMLFGPVLFR